jgi:KDO2-lipid IV(A) lauroyltransferase
MTKKLKKKKWNHSRPIQWLEYGVMITVVFFLSCLSHRAALALARAVGGFLYYCLPIRKKVAAENLAHAFPDKDDAWRNKIILSSYKHTLMTFIEAMRFYSLPLSTARSEIQSSYVLDKEENLRAVGWDKGPYIVATAHIGGYESCYLYFVLEGFQLTAVYKPLHNPLLSRWLAERRGRGKGRSFGVNEGIIKLIRSIKKEQRIPILVNDQDARKSGIFIDFFGRPASTFTGPAFMAFRLKIPFVPFFQVRHADDPARQTIVIHEAVTPPEHLDQEQAIEYMLKVWTQRLEDLI